ncbi:MAG: pyridoxamine 5'-phosphate oxidase [Chloroflexi bacterium]|nr:MAG: pyridoxamine 5'-phosphate oxidase [Chloroflexota bacterium]
MSRPEPAASRLKLPPGYRNPPRNASLLPWARARVRLEQAETYWIATAGPDGRPHVASLWGVWVEDALYFDGFSGARWARNLAANPAAVVHLDDGNDVVIVEGRVDDIVPPLATGEQVADAWSRKYRRLAPEPTSSIYRLTPHAARGWTSFPDDVTSWTFPEG